MVAKRVVSEATKAKMRATWAAKRAAKAVPVAKATGKREPLVDDALFYLRRAVTRMKEDFKAGRKAGLNDSDMYIHAAIRCLEGEKI